MRILALDTATAASTVALAVSADQVFVSEEVVGTGHAERTAAQIVEILDAAGCPPGGVELIAVGIGPGPYTSTRVGVSMAQGLGLAVGAPVVGMCTLDVIARACEQDQPFGVAMDARRREIYWAIYDEAGRRTMGPCVGRPDDVLARSGMPLEWQGDGFDRFPRLVDEHAIRISRPRFPSARSLAAIVRQILDRGASGSFGTFLAGSDGHLDSHAGDGSVVEVPAGRLLEPNPLYLRRPDAKPPRDAMPHPELRNMRWPDIPSVLPLEAQMFGQDAWSAETFWSELAGVPDRRTYLVAETAQGVVGYGGMAWLAGDSGPSADLQTLAVAAESRRRGIGRRILSQLLAEARRRGCVECLLEVRADSSGALALYGSAGFVEIARRARYYRDGTDAVIMRCHLPGGGHA